MTTEERDTIVKYRLERANETLLEAKDMICMKHWHGAANRLYYACYYAVSALLIKNGYSARTHNGVLTLLGKHFVLKGIVSKEQNDLYTTFLELRQGGDYGDWVVITEDMVAPLIEPAKKFIQEIEKLINNPINP